MPLIRKAITRISRRIIATQMLVSVLLLGAFGGFVAKQASVQNALAASATGSLVVSSLQSQRDHLVLTATDYAVWDAAYRNLVLRFDAGWVDRTFGRFVWDTLPTRPTGAFFVDGEGRTRYGMWGRAYTALPITAHLGPVILPLLDRVRRGGPPVSAVIVTHGVPQLVALSAVRPASGQIRERAGPRGVIVWVQAVDAAMIATMRRDAGIHDLAWRIAPARGEIAQPEKAGDPAAGNLVWQAADPGSRLLRTAIWPAIFLGILCILAARFQARLTMRAAAILTAEHEGRRQVTAMARTLREQANTDPLTGLLNRRGLEQAWKSLKAPGAVLVDLDRFKPVNDTHGHDVGDEVLREVARRLDRSIRGSDVATRLGGDEFVLLIERADRARLEFLAERLVQALAQPYICSVGLVRIGASVGLAAPIEEEELDHLVRRADRALFEAKQRGRARWHMAA